MITIILNSSNVVADSLYPNSKFLYQFPLGGITFNDDLIAVQSISQYFSCFNINTIYNNGSFQYVWVDGTVNTVTIPNGFYQLADINAYFRSIMYANKHYLLDSGGNDIYLLELVINQSRYATQLNCYMISVAIAAANTWTLPAGATWVLPTNIIVPELIVLSTNNFGLLIGYEAGTYPNAAIAGVPPAQTQTPAYTTSQSFLSTKAPQITPYSSFLVYCTLVNNRAVIPSQLIYSYTPENATFGALQNYQPTAELGWNKIENGHYPQFIVEIRDQLGNQVAFQDPNTLITLLVRKRLPDEVMF